MVLESLQSMTRIDYIQRTITEPVPAFTVPVVPTQAKFSGEPLPSSFRDHFGSVRVKRVREALDFNNPNLDRLRMAYREWVEHSEYLTLEGFLEVGRKRIERKTVFVKASKRGNDVYQNRVIDRLKPLIEASTHSKASKLRGKRKGSLVLLTLTYDRAEPSGSMADYWRRDGDLNRFFAHIRKDYRKIDYVWVEEAHKNGFPHYHILIWFHDKEFVSNPWYSPRQRRFINLINPKGLFNKYWPVGYVDVKGVDNLRSTVQYVTKYLIKGLGKNATLNEEKARALCWFYGKRSFGLSRGFLDLIQRCITKTKGWTQQSLYDEKYTYLWRFLGIFPYWFVGLDPETRVSRCDRPPPQAYDVWDLRKRDRVGAVLDYRGDLGKIIYKVRTGRYLHD